MDWSELPQELQLATHSLHDAGALLLRWEETAGAAAADRLELGTDAGFALPIFTFGAAGSRSLYLSAGIHGDEAVPPWALWHFCTQRAERLKRIGAFVVPLWNPAGLAANTRVDGAGLDRNRLFHRRPDARLDPWRAALDSWRFAAAMALHEDYDARGWYLYEISPDRPRFAPALSRALDGVMAPDPRAEIEERPANQGVIWAEALPQDMPEWPEVFDFGERGPVVLTFETPSEAGIEIRARAQLAVLETLLAEVE